MKSNRMKWKRISSNIYKKQVIKYSRRGLLCEKSDFGNLVLIANSEYSDNLVKIPTCSSSGLAFCVELWPKQVWYRISVPMSYIYMGSLNKYIYIYIYCIIYYISLATIWENDSCESKNVNFWKVLEILFW